MLQLEKRKNPSKFWAIGSPIIAVFATMIAGGIMFAILGSDPLVAIKTIFWDPLFNTQFASYSRPQLLVKAGPLILIAIGLAMGFRAGIWNIGAEGQYIMGAVIGGAVGLALYPLDAWFVLPLMVLFGGLGGALWAFIPAILRAKFNTNEILVSIFLVYVAQNILAAMSLGPLRNPDGQGFPGSRNFKDFPAAHNDFLIPSLGLHWGVVFALVAVIIAWFVMKYHVFGFRLRLLGESPRAAKFAGVPTGRMIVYTFLISGGLAGFAGLFEVTGPGGQITESFNSGYGFTAIIVAFLGRLNPIGILLGALLLGLTYIGGELAQLMLGLPSASISAFQGMLLFFILATDVLTNYRVKLTLPGTARKA
ncbi:MAG: ABC transporter permease [Planktomarina sp.]